MLAYEQYRELTGLWLELVEPRLDLLEDRPDEEEESGREYSCMTQLVWESPR